MRDSLTNTRHLALKYNPGNGLSSYKRRRFTCQEDDASITSTGHQPDQKGSEDSSTVRPHTHTTCHLHNSAKESDSPNLETLPASTGVSSEAGDGRGLLTLTHWESGSWLHCVLWIWTPQLDQGAKTGLGLGDRPASRLSVINTQKEGPSCGEVGRGVYYSEGTAM